MKIKEREQKPTNRLMLQTKYICEIRQIKTNLYVDFNKFYIKKIPQGYELVRLRGLYNVFLSSHHPTKKEVGNYFIHQFVSSNSNLEKLDKKDFAFEIGRPDA